MAKRSNIPWLLIQNDYIAGLNLAELAKKHIVSRQAIWRRMKHDAAQGFPWIQSESAKTEMMLKAKQRAQNKAASSVSAQQQIEMQRRATQGAADRIADQVAERVTDDFVDTLIAQQAFVTWLGRLIRESEADLKKIQGPGERIRARREITEMGEKWVKLARLDSGLIPGQASDYVPPSEDGEEVVADNRLIIEQRRLEPVRITVDEAGRLVS